MLIYIKGSDSFLAKQAIDQIKAKYLEKNPTGTELLEINTEETLPNWADLQAVPLFATSRLVIIKKVGFLLVEAQRSLANFLSHLPPTTVLVVWDGKKPLADLAEALKIATKVIPAEPLALPQLRQFIRRRATTLGISVDNQTVDQLLESAGADLWFIETELRYLATSPKREDASVGKKGSDEPFIYFNFVRRGAWREAARRLQIDYDRGQPFELLLGSLGAAIRKELKNIPLKKSLVNLLLDIDFGVKTGLLEPGEGVSLLAYHLPNPAASRVEWEQVWEETIA